MSSVSKQYLPALFLGAALIAAAIGFPNVSRVGVVSLAHAILAFNLETTTDVTNAQALGVQYDVYYGTPPQPTSTLGTALQAANIKVIDANISSQVDYWECHREHTILPVSNGCTDVVPTLVTEQDLLNDLDAIFQADASNSLVAGYWILDDWPQNDPGSAKQLLPSIKREILKYTPTLPAICGFGVTLQPSNYAQGYYEYVAQNYNAAGCDMVGIYDYASYYSTQNPVGLNVDYTMTNQLPTILASLKAQGWNAAQTPLIGIGQAFYGLVNTGLYAYGLTTAQMVQQATAFCNGGATSIAWYAYNDLSYISATQTPNNSTIIQSGISQSMSACKAVWGIS